jgi:hypothetical protein
LNRTVLSSFHVTCSAGISTGFSRLGNHIKYDFMPLLLMSYNA